METTCLNCGEKVKILSLHIDELGEHIVCPHCESSFDIDVASKMSVTITEDEFYEHFNCVKNHIDDNASFDGCMFETYGKELEYIREKAQEVPCKVWTILDCDGQLYYSSGFYFVNRFGYLITEEIPAFQIEVELEDLTEDEEGEE